MSTATEAPATAEHDEVHDHPSDLKYIKIALILAAAIVYSFSVSHFQGTPEVGLAEPEASPNTGLGEQNLPAFYEMYQREFPGVWGVLNYIQGLWQSEVHSHRWTMPDGFEVIQWNNGL